MNSDIYVALAENSPHANFVYDLDGGQFLYLNPASKALLNLSSNNVDIKSLFKLIPDEDQTYLNKCFDSFLKGTLEKDIEFRLRVQDTDERWIRLTPFQMNNTQKISLIFGNAMDITAEVQNLYTYKKYANKKNSILNILAHDLLGPLGIAQTISSILADKIDDPKLKGLIDTIEKVNKQAIDLIRDLTEREFLETTEVVLVKKRINVAAKLREVIHEYQKSSAYMERTFHFYSSGDDIFLDLDESKFIQIINNLMSNALKFTKKNGIITLKIDEQGDSVIFSVSDNGIGIPEQFHPTLFDKFTNARRKGLQGEPTVGLGMSIIKTIVEWHNGKIWFESKENAGTTVYFELPKTA